MALAVTVTLRGVTREQYDAVRAQAGWIEQPPAGGIAHVTWWEGDDCHNLDAWESEAAFEAFGEHRLGPAMAAVGVTTPPEVTMRPAHEVFTPRAGVVAPTASPSLSQYDNVSLVRSGYGAFAAGDIAAVLALFDERIDWYTPDTVRFGGRHMGPAAVGAFFSRLPENFSELIVEPLTYIDRADTVVVLGRHRARTAVGTAIELPFVHVWTLSNGKVTSFTEHFDTTKMNVALGGDAHGIPQQSGASTSVRV